VEIGRGRYRGKHIGREFEDVVGADDGAYIAKAGKGVPHEGVDLERIDEVVDRLFGVAMGCVELSQHAVAGGGIGHVAA
jgi:hypothetical protein